jgi:hypothetical protein
VKSAILANGTYPVDASVVDGAGNTGSATQQLTINTVPPDIAIDGGSSGSTNDRTPTIAGTSNVAPGTTVTVTLDSQTLTALVQSAGTWSVVPTALPDGSYGVNAAVTDQAGNQSDAGQVLTVDTVAPALAIRGGADALTNDPTPVISGTAGVPTGSVVTATVANQTLAALVESDGGWKMTAASLPDGPHRIIVSVSDRAGNVATVTQTLTVDTVPPTIKINAGANAITSNLDPTIAGTSNAAPGTTVTVSIAGQEMTTLLQTNGTWNTTPTSVGRGTWRIDASDQDPAGNVGRAEQTLTISTAPGVTETTRPNPTPGPSGTTGSTGPTGPRGTTGPTGAARLKASLSATSYKAARGKRVEIAFVLNAAAKVTVTVLRGKKTIATLRMTRTKAGRSSLTWNGKIKRKLAAKGMYKIELRAVSPSRATSRGSATLHIT